MIRNVYIIKIKSGILCNKARLWCIDNCGPILSEESMYVPVLTLGSTKTATDELGVQNWLKLSTQYKKITDHYDPPYFVRIITGVGWCITYAETVQLSKPMYALGVNLDDKVLELQLKLAVF